jgi:uncharacterized protein
LTTYERLADVPSAPGRYVVRIPVTVDLSGLDVAIWTHALVGDRPGPTLLLLSGAHGNEWGHIEFMHRFVRDFDPAGVSGTVLVVPQANQPALGALTRAVPDDSDQPDVNRSYPGEGRRFTWLAEQIATALATTVIARSNAVLEFHLGIWGSAMGSSIVGNDYTDERVRQGCMDLALIFGVPLIFATRAVSGFPGPRSLLGYAGERAGVPTSGSMIGGTGFERPLEQRWQQANEKGIANVMAYMGMVDGQPDMPDSYLVYETVQRVNPRVGGLLLPARPTEEFGREVRAGEVLGHVVSPYTLDVIETLEVPMDGFLAYWSRDYPVHPGDWAFGVIPTDHPGTRRVRLGEGDLPRWSPPA